jgi:hypothetical protein
MSTVIVLGTVHEERGVCTSEELFKIIQEIKPEVIFCETSLEKLPKMLKATDSFNTPEIKVIRRLIKGKSIQIVPIDEIEDSFDQRLEAMFSLFKRKMKVYSNASTILSNEAYLKGFPFLNSLDGDKIFRDQNDMEMYFIEKAKNHELSKFHSDWSKWNDKRENQWINIIHDYFKINNPKKAVFLVGAGHRFRLIDKIKNIEESNKLFFDWDFFHFK